jgi:dolichol kinase
MFTAQSVMGVICSAALVSTIIESFPATVVDDNISVPLVAAAIAYTLGTAV